jgi:GDSL-like Lipase/Acylhydrolase family
MVRRRSPVRVRKRAFSESPCKLGCSVAWADTTWRLAGTPRVHILGLAGIRGHARRLVSLRDTPSPRDESALSRESPAYRHRPLSPWARNRPPPCREGVDEVAVSGLHQPERFSRNGSLCTRAREGSSRDSGVGASAARGPFAKMKLMPKGIYLALGDSISIDDYTGVRGGGAASQFALKLDLELVDLTRDGNTTQGVLADLAGAPASADVVTLTAGGNDLLGGDSPRAILRRLRQIADRLQPLGARVIVNTVYDPSDGDNDVAPRARSLAAGDDRATTAAERTQRRNREAGPGAWPSARRSRAALPRARPCIRRAVVRPGDRAEPCCCDRHR